MDKQKVLSRLLCDLQSFLLVLDLENLSYIAQAQRKSISELLSQLQGADGPEDAEYMIMNCPSLSLSNEQINTPGTDADGLSELVLKQGSPVRLTNGGPAALPLPPGGPGGGAADDEDDDDTYEEAAPYVAETGTSNTEKTESDSSHYESYGEEEDENDEEEPVKDRAHYIQWSASQPCLRPAPESRICGYLWRRKWLGQWIKQLFIIRKDVLLCYKCAQDLLPQLELNLQGCHLVYKSKCNRKVQHQLKLVLLGSETLVLGYSSFQQADEWRRVIQEVSGVETPPESSPTDQMLSCRSGSLICEGQKVSPPQSLRHKGYLSVMMNCQWQSLLCQVNGSLLNMFGEEEGVSEAEHSPQYSIPLTGCEIRDGPDTEHSYRIRLSISDQVAVLEVSSPEEKRRWLKVLQDGAANHSYHDNKSTQDSIGGGPCGLQLQKFPTSNNYMDDPIQVPQQSQHIYSNSSILEHQLRSSQDSVWCSSMLSKDSVTYSNTILTKPNRKSADVERGVQKLELTEKRRVHLRAGSEINLTSAGKHNKRTSFRQSLAVCTERAQAGFLNPLLRRTASAKTSLRRAPSSLFIEHGKVFQRRKEWETKASA
ncbi:actin filament-associated protein 1-like 2 isoform X1 [Takifugu flavidus]|uniref:actin filament-associated protein 1-like 2 isoform X1 n=1 Tax=Takifugu flavidus TaxID=433684 RepID=UPI002544AD05|nr:actin filament-associated protein 1-like 2 isoform X1 [Takifugu flavidus]